LLRPYHPDDGVLDELYRTEMANLPLFGYGIKSFTLSMIETAIRVSGGEIGAGEIQRILEIAREMKQAPVQLLDGVEEVVRTLSASHRLMLITKGDLLDQQLKIDRSGLAPYFEHIEVVTNKTPGVYREVLAALRIRPERFCMVGNSLRSDILPVVSLGAHAVHIPYHLTWAHETVPVQPGGARGYVELEHIGLLPEWIGRLGSQSSKQKEVGS
jgi:putative hydrolase of the HAD superfamily